MKKDVTVTSVVGGGTLAKFEDANGVLGENVSIQAAELRKEARFMIPPRIKWRR